MRWYSEGLEPREACPPKCMLTSNHWILISPTIPQQLSSIHSTRWCMATMMSDRQKRHAIMSWVTTLPDSSTNLGYLPTVDIQKKLVCQPLPQCKNRPKSHLDNCSSLCFWEDRLPNTWTCRKVSSCLCYLCLLSLFSASVSHYILHPAVCT